MPKPFRGNPSFFSWSSNSLAYFTRPLRPSSCSGLWLHLCHQFSSIIYFLYIFCEMCTLWGTDIVISWSKNTNIDVIRGPRALSPVASSASSKPQTPSLFWCQTGLSVLRKYYVPTLKPLAGIPHPSYHTPTQLSNFCLLVRSQLNQINTFKEAFQASPEQVKFSLTDILATQVS